MRPEHFAALAPICPRCRSGADESQWPLTLEPWQDARAADGSLIIVSGRLHCPAANCRQEYPIVDGVPILVPDVRGYVEAFQWQLLGRHDLDPQTESLLGDCLGPDHVLNQTRQYLSTYAGDGYSNPSAAEFPAAAAAVGNHSTGVVSLLEALLALAPHPLPAAARILDLGCAVGRSSLALAERLPAAGLVLGVDQQFGMVRFAQQLLRTGQASYPLRAAGMVYHPQSVQLAMPIPASVDYWVCDATALPFADQCMHEVLALNLLDAVAEPYALLQSAARVLVTGGQLRLATPFEWSSQVTPPAQWIGGHSQRAELQGEPVAVLKALLAGVGAETPGLRVLAEQDNLRWQTRVTARSTMLYQAYGLVLERG